LVYSTDPQNLFVLAIKNDKSALVGSCRTYQRASPDVASIEPSHEYVLVIEQSKWRHICSPRLLDLKQYGFTAHLKDRDRQLSVHATLPSGGFSTPSRELLNQRDAADLVPWRQQARELAELKVINPLYRQECEENPPPTKAETAEQSFGVS
jgi:hypothetical protein